MEAKDYELVEELRERGHGEIAQTLEQKLRETQVTPNERRRRGVHQLGDPTEVRDRRRGFA